jgi:hypothetical protein
VKDEFPSCRDVSATIINSEKKKTFFLFEEPNLLVTEEWLFVILAIGTAKYRLIHMFRINPQNTDQFQMSRINSQNYVLRMISRL